MSTKTTFKRVALVAVAALGLGVLSVAPSQATADDLTITAGTVTYGSSVTTPTVGASVSIPVSLAIGAGTITTWDTITATITKPNNSGIANESVTAAATGAGTMLALSRTAEKNALGVFETTAAGVLAGQAGIFSFTPDVPGKYTVTLTATPGASALKSVKTVEINVGGIAITQGATNLGKAITGTQILGRPSTFTFNVPAGAAAGARYTITSTGAITTVLSGITNLGSTASAHTSPTGVSVVSGTTYAAGAIYTTQAGVNTSQTLQTANYPGAMEQVSIQVESPAAAGTVDVKVTTADALTGEVTTVATGTVTYAAVAVVAKAASAVTQLATGTNTATAAVGAVDSVVAGSKVPAATVARIGSIAVKLLNASGVEVTESYTATITGAGTLGHSIAGTTTVIGRSITVKQGADVYIFADGTGGVGTITITTAAGLVVATKTVSFYGDASVIVLSSNSNAVVGLLAAPVKATAYDAAGYVVKGAAVYATSSDTTIISNSYAGPYTTAADGTVSIPLTGVKLGTAKITVGLATSATDVTTTGYAVKSDALTVTVGGSTSQQAGVVVTTDKQVYTPGSYAYVTVKAVDAAGKTLSPLPSSGKYTVFATGGIAASLPIETVTGIISAVDFTPAAKAGTATTADPIVAQAGEMVYKIKLPAYSGDVVLSWTTAAASNFPGNIAAGGVAGSVTVSLSDPGSQAAVDAATEATDAANAATDAALAAADAADAATAAAEDASAAVATLAKSVNTALGNLKKQITALTALVNKLLKK